MSVKRRRLGRTELEISEIGFGCGPTAGLIIRATPEQRRAAVTRALDLGITYFDTAPVYGDTLSEANLGQTLRELGVHPTVVTKVALEENDFADLGGATVRSVEASLKRLGLPSVPLVQLHNRVGQKRAARPDFGSGALLTVDDVLGPDGVVAALRSLRERGLVRYFGCCAFGGEMAQVERLIDSGMFDSLLVNYSVVNQTAWLPSATSPLPGRHYAGVAARAAGAGMGTSVLRVLEGGALSGTELRHPLAGAAGPEYAANLARARSLRPVIDPANLTLPEAAIRFALSNPQVSTVLVGFSDVAQIEEAATFAAKGPLPADILAGLRALADPNTAAS